MDKSKGSGRREQNESVPKKQRLPFEESRKAFQPPTGGTKEPRMPDGKKPKKKT